MMEETLENNKIENDLQVLPKHSSLVKLSMDGAESASKKKGGINLLYTIEEQPQWYLGVLLGFQHYLTMAGATLTIPILLANLMCLDRNDPARGNLFSTVMFVSGIATLLQTSVGIRLPVIQGGTASFLAPTITIVTTGFISCQEIQKMNLTTEEYEETWQQKMREVQGAIVIASIFETLIGLTGCIGFLVRWISPLSIVPTITLIGLSLFEIAAETASENWGIALLTVILLKLFSQYLPDVAVPVPTFRREGREGGFRKLKIFALFPVLFSVSLAWLICAILTFADALAPNSKARVDSSIDVVYNAPWIIFPYPFQWGMPTFSLAGSIGMMAGVIASVLDSLGNYYACAKLAEVSPPPIHAINRGIAVEGIGCLLAAIWGTGNGSTTYSENVAAIGVTRVATRRVMQYGALFMIVFGMMGKFCALAAIIPAPVVGGLFIVVFSFVTAIGLSPLQYVNLNSPRNLYIIGFSLFFGLCMPMWIKEHKEVIDTGSAIIDQVLLVLLQTSMFLGGLIGFTLDNTIPGTDEERGLKWNREMDVRKEGSENVDASNNYNCYNLPCGMDVIKRNSWTSKIPISPTFASWK